MSSGASYYLTQRVCGYKGNEYGKAGEEVQLIADHGNVMIVKGIGDPFPVRLEHLTQKKEKPAEAKETRVIEPATPPSSKSKRKGANKTITQSNTLF